MTKVFAVFQFSCQAIRAIILAAIGVQGLRSWSSWLSDYAKKIDIDLLPRNRYRLEKNGMIVGRNGLESHKFSYEIKYLWVAQVLLSSADHFPEAARVLLLLLHGSHPPKIALH